MPQGPPPRPARCGCAWEQRRPSSWPLVGDEPHGGADQVVPAQVWTTDWGQVATGRLRGGLVGPSHSPARPAPRREVPPLRSGAPRHAPVGQFGAHAAPVKEAPSSAWTQMPRVLNSPSTAAPTAMWAARLETWWSARTLTRIAPGVDHGVERLQRPALPLQDGVAHRVGDLRGSFPRSEAAPIVDARWWRISRTVMPGRTS